MTDPSKERIAAALALAEAVEDLFPSALPLHIKHYVDAYRATLPKLRSRAEVDAEIAKLTRQCVENEWAGDDDYAMWEAVTKLCREPTTDSGPSSVDTTAEVHPPASVPVSPAGANLFECPFCRCTQGRHVIWCQYPRTSGPPGVAGERECNRDQALGLEDKLRDIGTEIELWLTEKKASTAAMSAIRLILRGEP